MLGRCREKIGRAPHRGDSDRGKGGGAICRRQPVRHQIGESVATIDVLEVGVEDEFAVLKDQILLRTMLGAIQQSGRELNQAAIVGSLQGFIVRHP